ncbi:MAG: hypothetical protein R3C10_25710 [Pirellulales bacterium]
MATSEMHFPTGGILPRYWRRQPHRHSSVNCQFRRRISSDAQRSAGLREDYRRAGDDIPVESGLEPFELRAARTILKDTGGSVVHKPAVCPQVTADKTSPKGTMCKQMLELKEHVFTDVSGHAVSGGDGIARSVDRHARLPIELRLLGNAYTNVGRVCPPPNDAALPVATDDDVPHAAQLHYVFQATQQGFAKQCAVCRHRRRQRRKYKHAEFTRE